MKVSTYLHVPTCMYLPTYLPTGRIAYQYIYLIRIISNQSKECQPNPSTCSCLSFGKSIHVGAADSGLPDLGTTT